MLHLRTLIKILKPLSVKHLFLNSKPQVIFTPYRNFFTKKSRLPIDDLVNSIKTGLQASQNNMLDDSITHFKHVVETFDAQKGKIVLSKEEFSLLLRAHYELGRVYERKNYLTESQIHFEEALSLISQAQLQGSLEHGDIKNAIGRVFLKQSKYYEETAQDSLRESREIFGKLTEEGKLDSKVLDSIHMKAMLNERQYQGNRVLELLEYVLDREETSRQGQSSLDLPLLYNSLGGMYLNMNEEDKAVGSWRKALDKCIKENGEASHKTLALYHSIIQSLARQRKYQEANSYVDRCLNVARINLKQDDPKLAETLLMAGFINFQQGKHQEALENYETGLEILSKYPQQYWEEVWMAKLTVAEIYLTQGKENKATTLFKEAEEKIQKALGELHPELAGYYLYWADLLKFKVNNVKEAKVYYTKALEIYLVSGNIQDPKITDVCYEIGPTLFERNKYVYSFIGTLYFQQQKYEESVDCFSKAIESCDKSEKHLDVYSWNLGETFEKKGLVSRAIDFYQKSVEFAKETDKDGSKIKKYVGLLSETLSRLGREDEADKLRKLLK